MHHWLSTSTKHWNGVPLTTPFSIDITLFYSIWFGWIRSTSICDKFSKEKKPRSFRGWHHLSIDSKVELGNRRSCLQCIWTPTNFEICKFSQPFHKILLRETCTSISHGYVCLFNKWVVGKPPIRQIVRGARSDYVRNFIKQTHPLMLTCIDWLIKPFQFKHHYPAIYLKQFGQEERPLLKKIREFFPKIVLAWSHTVLN